MSLSSFNATITSLINNADTSSRLVSIEQIQDDIDATLLHIKELLELPPSNVQKTKIALYEKISEKLEYGIRLRKAEKPTIRHILTTIIAFQVFTVLMIFTIIMITLIISKWSSAAMNIESTASLISIAQDNISFVWIAVVINVLAPIFIYLIHPHILIVEMDKTYKEVRDIRQKIASIDSNTLLKAQSDAE